MSDNIDLTTVKALAAGIEAAAMAKHAKHLPRFFDSGAGQLWLAA